MALTRAAVAAAAVTAADACDLTASTNVSPFQPLSPSTGKHSEWSWRLYTIEFSLAVVVLLFVLACSYMFMYAKNTNNTSLKAGGAFLFLIGLTGLAVPMVSVALQYNSLKDAACGGSTSAKQ